MWNGTVSRMRHPFCLQRECVVTIPARPSGATSPMRRAVPTCFASMPMAEHIEMWWWCGSDWLPRQQLQRRPLNGAGVATVQLHERHLCTTTQPERLACTNPDTSAGSWPKRYAAAGGPNQAASASKSSGCGASPAQATYPSGRINTAVGAGTMPSTGSSQAPS